MGLPSRTLWAAVNLGAKKNTEAGLFYQWGAVEGHIDASEFAFNEANYNSQQLDLITEDLSLEHDAASVYFGDPAVCMPSIEDFNELFNSEFVSVSDITVSGTRGMLVRSLSTGNAIFFPRLMGRYVGNTYQSTTFPHFWTKNYQSSSLAVAALVSTPSAITSDEDRWDGLTIRPVKKL